MLSRALNLAAGFRTLLGIHALSTVFSIINALAFTQFLTPQDYALFSICGAFVVVGRILGRWGMPGFLVNGVAEAQDRDYNLAVGYLGLLMVIVTPLLAVAAGAVAWLAAQPRLVPYLLFCTLIPTLAIPASVLTPRLEREFRLMEAGLIDIGAQVCGLTVALILFWQGYGLWSPIIGLAVRVGMHSVLLSAVNPQLRPQFNRARFAEMVSFGFRQTIVMSLSQSRPMLLLTLLTRLLGEHLAGHYALAVRLYDMVNPTRSIITRIVPGSLADDAVKRGYRPFAIAQLARLETVSSMVLVVVLMPSAAWLVPRVLGAAWVDTGLYLMPIAAAAALTAPMLPLWNVLVARRHFSLAARHMLLMIASEASALGLLTPWLGSSTAVAIPFVCLGPLLLLQRRCKLDGIADWPMRNTLLAGSATAAFCLAMRQFF